MSEIPKVLPLDDLPFAFGVPQASARIRSVPADFIVNEIAGFEPSGEGDHVFLTLQKTELTTHAVVGMLKKFTGLRDRDIGVAGMKDKFAVTTQTFSLNMSGKQEPDWQALNTENLQVKAVSRHNRKLKRGVLKGNRFTLHLRELLGDHKELESRLNAIARHGVPNYFGQQRFGRDGDNPLTAWKMFTEPGFRVRRDERSILLSSVRSMLFNAVLAERVRRNNWQQLLEGEVINLDSTERHFAEKIDATLIERAQRLDVHGTGPMAGKPSRALTPELQAGAIEQAVLDGFQPWVEQLLKQGLEHGRRPLRLAVKDLDWEFAEGALTLSFALTSGAYATSVLRELVNLQ